MEIHTPKIVFNQATVSGGVYYSSPFYVGPGASVQIEMWDEKPCAVTLQSTNNYQAGTNHFSVKWANESATVNPLTTATVSGTEITHLGNINAFKSRLKLTPSGTGPLKVSVTKK